MTDNSLALAQKVSLDLSSGKISLQDVWEALSKAEAEEKASSKTVAVPAKPQPITQEQSDAMKRLPEIYGKVSPTEVRALTPEEAATLVEEREVIDTILGFIKKRKDDSIREIIANHLDQVLVSKTSPEDLSKIPIDKKGHYQQKQEVAVEGTGKKFQKTVSNPSPNLSMAAVEKAHADGLLTREQYLSITRLPEVPRVLDENKMASAVKKDPSLLFVLSGLTTRAPGTTTIKVEKDSS